MVRLTKKINETEGLHEPRKYTAVLMDKLNWRSALSIKLFEIKYVQEVKSTLGYDILYYLWSMDIWINGIPMLKSIIAANVIVWLVLFVR